MSLVDDMIREKISLVKKIELVNSKIAGSPEGYLICRKKGNYFRYYHCTRIRRGKKTAEKEIYLNKQSDLLLNLAKRDYYKQFIKDLQKDLHGIESYLKWHSGANNVQLYLEKHPGIREIVQPALIERKNKYFTWATEEYTKNPSHPENLIYITDGGFYVRSKSEQMIANMYLAEGIPFRYEDPVILSNGNIIYPDFHLFSLRDYSEFYHEHNGMMLNEEYYLHYENKLRKLRSAGIIPGVNLLQTFEADGYPLNPACVRDLINTYLK